MAKFFSIPNLDTLDIVFKVLSDPAASSALLKQLMDMRDEVNVRLGDLDSHEKAEASVATANALIAEVNLAHKKAVDAVEAATVNAAQIIDDARAEAASIIEKANAIDKQFKDNLADVKSRAAALDKREREMAVREKANADIATKLANQEADLVSREKQVAEKLQVAKRIAEAVAG